MVFSAYAEVVPSVRNEIYPYDSILRVRGGSSIPRAVLPLRLQYSPRTRR